MKKFIAASLAALIAGSVSVTAFAADDFNWRYDYPAFTATAALYNGDELVNDEPLPVKYEVVENGSNVAKPGGEVYILLLDDSFVDKDMWKVKTDKGDNNPKLIEKISVVEKDEGFEIAEALVNGRAGGRRQPLIKIKLRDVMDGEEYKLTPQVKFTAKDDIEIFGDGEVMETLEDVVFVVDITGWMGNVQRDGDEDWAAGTGGYVAKPTKDDENEVVWHNENDDIARLSFQADSDVTKYYPKLSTKWVDSTYSEVIGDADAFVVEFVGNPVISSTSRATLEIYNPYKNDDGEYDVAVEDLRVYLADADGVLTDVTDQCKLGTNDDDEEVITLRTRQLGTYIVTDGGAAVDSAEA